MMFQIFLAFFYFCWHIQGTHASGLQVEPDNIVVEYGSSVSVNCSIDLQHNGIGWEASEGSVLQTTDVQLITWKLESIQQWDIKPICFANFKDKDQMMSELNVTVYKIPDSVSISILNHTGPMYEGQQYELLCDIQNVAPIHLLTVNWYKGETLLANRSFTDPNKKPVNPLDRLQIFPNREDDGAQYRCETKLQLGPDGPQPAPTVTSDPLTITVYYGPEISCPNSITFLEGEPFNHNCTVKGRPQPEMKWWKDEHFVDLPETIFRYDEGEYTLMVANTDVSHKLEVKVETPPSKITELDDTTVYLGESVTLKCSSSAKPRAHYEWRFYDAPNVVYENVDGVSLLHINNANGLNIGNYTCVASNLHGTEEHTIKVAVEGAETVCPLIISPPNVVMEHGQTVKVTCTVSSNNSELHWEFLDSFVNSTTLHISSSQFVDWDEKPTCHGRFIGLEKCRKHLDVTLYKRPDSVSISILNHTGPMYEGQQYELLCDIQNVAPIHLLTVNWYKGETLLANRSFTDPNKKPVNKYVRLQIFPNREDDGAQYRCEAKLQLGPDGPQPAPTVTSDPLTITVHYKPIIYRDKLPAIILVFDHSEELLVCKADGNPKPTIKWLSNSKIISENENLTIWSSDGIFNCTATNAIGTDYREVKAMMKVLQIEPDNIVVEYGSSVSVNCSIDLQHEGIGWEASEGSVPLSKKVQLITWKLESLRQWDIKPICFATFENNIQKMSELNVTVYKIPDSVSISILNHTGPMYEGQQYELLCDIQNVAPIHLLTVNWYKGETLLANRSFTDPNKKPVNEYVRLPIFPNREDDGAQYRCEAKLQLGPDGPQPAPTVTSDPLTITVHYKPVIFGDKLPAIIPVFNGYPELLVCKADGNPEPTIKWLSGSKIISENENLTITVSDGILNCTATNDIGTTYREVQVIMKEDYLPVIAGIVAFVVVVISVFFVCIYSIYYKNTKMGVYNLHGAKPNPQNGNVAENGKDNSLPMKKIPMNHM